MTAGADARRVRFGVLVKEQKHREGGQAILALPPSWVCPPRNQTQAVLLGATGSGREDHDLPVLVLCLLVASSSGKGYGLDGVPDGLDFH